MLFARAMASALGAGNRVSYSNVCVMKFHSTDFVIARQLFARIARVARSPLNYFRPECFTLSFSYHCWVDVQKIIFCSCYFISHQNMWWIFHLWQKFPPVSLPSQFPLGYISSSILLIMLLWLFNTIFLPLYKNFSFPFSHPLEQNKSLWNSQEIYAE